jgi:lysophospholipase L1-like esterase
VKLVGFGCSFTYGTELINPDMDPNDHWANARYRERNVWLGQLAELLGATWNNLAEPANSNYAIQYQFADWFNNNRNPSESVVVCVAWTALPRFSWLDDTWTHNGTVRDDQKFLHSRKDWITSNVDHIYWTDAAKLFVNSVCKLHNIPILQFNALGVHKTASYDNYFLDGLTMQSVLKDAQKSDDRLNLFASGGHPNEAGHEYFTIRLHDFAKERII